jgi:hypothetical protein
LLVLVLLVGTVLVLGSALPIIRCPGCRGSVYQERLRHAQAAETPEHAAAIIAFAEDDECGKCRRGRLTPIGFFIIVANSGRCGPW